MPPTTAPISLCSPTNLDNPLPAVVDASGTCSLKTNVHADHIEIRGARLTNVGERGIIRARIRKRGQIESPFLSSHHASPHLRVPLSHTGRYSSCIACVHSQPHIIPNGLLWHKKASEISYTFVSQHD